MSLIEMAELKSINVQNVHFLQGVVELFTNTCQRYIRWQNFVVVTVNSRPGTKCPCTIIELGTVKIEGKIMPKIFIIVNFITFHFYINSIK